MVYLKPIIDSTITLPNTNSPMDSIGNYRPQIKGIMRCPGYVHESFVKEKHCLAQSLVKKHETLINILNKNNS